MKSAKEWTAEDPANSIESDCSDEEHEAFIRSIQSDALKHAANIADYELVPEVTEAANAQRIIAAAILSEANKLQ